MRLVLLILLLTPGLAWADPGSLLAATAFTIGSGATAIAVSWGTLVTIAGAVFGAAATRKQKKKAAAAAARQKADMDASLRDQMVSGTATEFPWRHAHGRTRVGANIVAQFPSGEADAYKHLVCVLAQHECEGIEEVYINGKAVGPLNGAGEATVAPFAITSYIPVQESKTAVATPIVLANVPHGSTLQVVGVYTYTPEYSPLPATAGGATVNFTYDAGTNSITVDLDSPFLAFVEGAAVTAFNTILISYNYRLDQSWVRALKHLGDPSDPADATTIAEVPGKWRSTDVLRGHTYFMLRLNLNHAEFQMGTPLVEVLLDGAKLYDPRTGLTEWSDNPALVAYHYLTSELGGVRPSAIPLASFIAAANDCDDIVTTGSWSGKRYTFNGVITSEQSREEVLEAIAQSMAGGIDATNWTIFAGKYSAPVMELTQEDIVGEFAFNGGPAMNEVFNTVRGQFISPENSYVATDYAPYQNAVYLAADDEELDTNIDLPFTNSQQRCTNLARIFTEDNRNGATINGTFSQKAFKLLVGQRFTFTAPFFGQNAKVYRVTDKKFQPGGMIKIGAKEDAESIYDLADEVQVDATPNTDLPNPFVVDALASLACESGTVALVRQADGTIVSGMVFTWPAATTLAVVLNGTIEIEIQLLGGTDWRRVTVSGNQTRAYISPVNDGQFYLSRARCVNPAVNVRSEWVYAALHQVIGKTELPATPEGLALTQTGVFCRPVRSELDVVGFLVRSTPGIVEATTADFIRGTELHQGFVTGFPWNFTSTLYGVRTVMVVSVDSSGNWSGVAYSSLDFGQPSDQNIGQTFDYRAAGWPGTHPDCTVVGGDLVSDGDPASSLNLLSDWNGEPDLNATQLLPLVYTTDPFVPAYGGGTLIYEFDAEGPQQAFDYRINGSTVNDLNAVADWNLEADLNGDSAGWAPWPGALAVQRGVGYSARVSIAGGSEQPQVFTLTAKLALQRVTQTFAPMDIAAAGTRLAPADGDPAVTWVVVQSVTMLPEVDGSGAVAGRFIDLSPTLGPLVQQVNSSGVPVDSRSIPTVGGLIDA